MSEVLREICFLKDTNDTFVKAMAKARRQDPSGDLWWRNGKTQSHGRSAILFRFLPLYFNLYIIPALSLGPVSIRRHRCIDLAEASVVYIIHEEFQARYFASLTYTSVFLRMQLVQIRWSREVVKEKLLRHRKLWTLKVARYGIVPVPTSIITTLQPNSNHRPEDVVKSKRPFHTYGGPTTG